MATTITADALTEHLTAILDRVKEQGERFVVQRDGVAVATLAPIGGRSGITVRQLVAEVGDLRMPGDGFADDLEAIQAAQGVAETPEWRG